VAHVAGPGGITGSRVATTVLPDTSKFVPALKKYLDRIEKSLRITIPTELDLRGLREDLERFKQQTERTRPSQLPVVPNTDLFAKRMQADVARIASQIEADIPLTADGEKFRREVQAQVERIKAQMAVEIPVSPEDAAAARNKLALEIDLLKAMAKRDPVEIPVELDADQAKLQRATRDVRRSLDGIRSSLLGMAGAGAKGLGFGALGVSALNALPAVAGLAVAVANASGALLVLPAAAGGAALAVGAIAVGMQGFGDALKNIGDAEKFNEALKNLSPNAAAAAQSIRSLVPAWTSMRKVVQDNLFKGVGASIQQLAGAYLPKLRQAFGMLAFDINAAGGGLKQFALAPQTRADFDTFFVNVSKAFRALAPAIAPALQVLRDLGTVGSQFLPGLSSSLANAAQRFAGFISTARDGGAINEWIQTGLTTMRQFGSIIGSVLTIVSRLVSTVAASGGGLAGIATVLDSIAQVVSGPVFTKGLMTFFQGVSQGASSLMSALPAVAGALAGLAAPLGQLATGVGKVAGSALTAIAGAVAKLTPALGPAITVLSSLATGVVSALAPLLSAVAQTVASVLAPAFQALIPVIPVVTGALQQFAGIISGALVQNLPQLAQVGSMLGTLIGTLASSIAPLIPMVAQVAATLLPIWIANMQRILPVLIEVAGAVIPKLVAVIGFLLPPLTKVAAFVLKMQTAWVDGYHAIVPAVSAIYGAVSRFFGAIPGVISGVVSTVQGKVTSGWSAVRNTTVTAFNAVVSGVKSAFSKVAGAVSSGVSTAIATVRGIPGQIKAALGNLGSLLFSAGQDVVAGMRNGIKSAAGGLASDAANMAKSALGAAKNALGIKSPSREFAKLGVFAVQGFRDGLLGTEKQVQTAVRNMMARILSVAENAADTKASFQKTLASLQKQLAAQQERIAPVRGTAAQRKAQAARNADARKRIADLNRQIGQTTKDMQALDKLAARVDSAGERSAINRMLTGQQALLARLASQRAAVADRLKAAQTKLADAVKVRDDFAANVKASVQQFASITSSQFNAQFDNAGDVIANMQARLDQIRAFKANLSKLKSLGLNNQTYKELVDAGVEGGAAAAEILAKGGKQAVGQVNNLASQITKEGSALGTEASKALYQAGVQAAQGLVKGLQSQATALAKASQNIANQLVAALKKALGIKSPSRVLADEVGRHIPTGIVRGIDSTAAQLDRRMASLVTAATPDFDAERLGGGGVREVHIHGHDYDTADTIATRVIGKLEFQGAA
jgi:phage-related protein